MRQIMLSFSFLLIMGFSLQAQQYICGNHPGEEGAAEKRNRLLYNIRMAAENPGTARDISYVPIRFHLGAESDGDGRRSEMDVLDQLCELNEDFGPYEIQFFLADNGFNYINNTTFYENHGATQNSVMQLQRDNRALDVFIVKSADTEPNSGGGTVLAYYNIPRDWIVITKGFIGKNDATLTHEIGHFFSLDHTFFGWEEEPYNIENDPAPSFSPGGIATERVNGSNCENAGDAICDTPPDYNNGIGWSGCDFTRNVLDPLGVQINPDERNYLSYFLSCPDEDYFFSDLQNDAMQFDLNSGFRNYLRLDPVPTIAEITGTATAISPTGNETTPNPNSALLQWSAVTNATAYVVEVSRVTSFSVNPIRMVVYGTSQEIVGLDDDKKYYWRVRPFNAHYACTSNSDIESFTTSDGTVATHDLSFVEDFTVSPNPVASNSMLNLQLNSAESFKGQVHLLDITGRPVGISIDHQFGTGQQQLSIPLNHLSNGIYLLQLSTEKGMLTEKVVIAN